MADTPRSGNLTIATSCTSAPDFDGADTPSQNHIVHSPHFPWFETQTDSQIVSSNGEVVKAEISAQAYRGFFIAQENWTCYRRNYFGINASYTLSWMPPGTSLFTDGKQIKALAMHITATSDDQYGKAVQLVQYTPKRDLGGAVVPTKVPPSGTTGPFPMPFQSILPQVNLPLQYEIDHDSPRSPSLSSKTPSGSHQFPASHPHCQQDPSKHAFERIQFKGATLNNGKRKASQQFYVLLVELVADVREAGACEPTWKRVAYAPSEKLIVRGRSPRHYKESDGKANGHFGRGGHHGNLGCHGGNGSSRGPHGGNGSPGGPPGANPHSGNIGTFRLMHNYSISPTSSYSGTSPSSNGETIVDIKYQAEPTMTRDELSHMQNIDDYRYYPITIYKGAPVSTKMEGAFPLPSITTLDQSDDKATVMEDCPVAVPGSHWEPGTYDKYLPTDSSWGWYYRVPPGMY